MATAKQIAASRANAQKSTGPRIEFGKAASRFNALKHGIDAQQQIMFTESAADLAELAAEYHDLHQPANAGERFLVDTLVNNEWRLRRMRCVEADLWVVAHNTPNVDFANPFPESYLQRVRSVDGVERADNLLVWFATVSLPGGAKESAVIYALRDFSRWNLPLKGSGRHSTSR